MLIVEREHKIEMAAADWIIQVPEDATLGMHVMARVKETKTYFTWSDADDDSFVLEKPQLDIEVHVYICMTYVERSSG